MPEATHRRAQRCGSRCQQGREAVSAAGDYMPDATLKLKLLSDAIAALFHP